MQATTENERNILDEAKEIRELNRPLSQYEKVILIAACDIETGEAKEIRNWIENGGRG